MLVCVCIVDCFREYCAGSYDQLDDPYRRNTGVRHDNGRYGMYAGGAGNYHRLGPAAAGSSREGGHPPPPSVSKDQFLMVINIEKRLSFSFKSRIISDLALVFAAFFI